MNSKNKKDLTLLIKMIKEGNEDFINRNNYEYGRLGGLESEIVKFLHYNGIVLKPLIKFYNS